MNLVHSVAFQIIERKTRQGWWLMEELQPKDRLVEFNFSVKVKIIFNYFSSRGWPHIITMVTAKVDLFAVSLKLIFTNFKLNFIFQQEVL